MKSLRTMYGLPCGVLENFISDGRTPLSLSILRTSNCPMSVPLYFALVNISKLCVTNWGAYDMRLCGGRISLSLLGFQGPQCQEHPDTAENNALITGKVRLQGCILFPKKWWGGK